MGALASDDPDEMPHSGGDPEFKGVLAIRRIFSLVDMITNTKFSNGPNVFNTDVVQQ